MWCHDRGLPSPKSRFVLPGPRRFWTSDPVTSPQRTDLLRTPHHQRCERGPELEDPNHQEDGLWVPEPGALQDHHLLPLRRAGPLPRYPRNSQMSHKYEERGEGHRRMETTNSGQAHASRRSTIRAARQSPSHPGIISRLHRRTRNERLGRSWRLRFPIGEAAGRAAVRPTLVGGLSVVLEHRIQPPHPGRVSLRQRAAPE